MPSLSQATLTDLYRSRICSSLFCNRAIVSLDFCNSDFNCWRSVFSFSLSSSGIDDSSPVVVWGGGTLLAAGCVNVAFVVVKGESDWRDAAGGNIGVTWWYAGTGPLAKIRFRCSRPLTASGCRGARNKQMLSRETSLEREERCLHFVLSW